MFAMLNGRRRLRKSFDEPRTLPQHSSSIAITLHDDVGPVLNETRPVDVEVRASSDHRRPRTRSYGGGDKQVSNRSHSKFEAQTSALSPPEPVRKDVDSGSSEHSPEGTAELRSQQAFVGLSCSLAVHGDYTRPG